MEEDRPERALKSLEGWISYKEKKQLYEKKKKKFVIISRKNKSYLEKKKEHSQIPVDEAMDKMYPDERFNQNCIQWFWKAWGKSREYVIAELGSHPLNKKPTINT